MAGLARPIDDKALQHLEELRCAGCRRLLLRIDAGALRPGKMLQTKCPKCDFFTYEIGKSS